MNADKPPPAPTVLGWLATAAAIIAIVVAACYVAQFLPHNY